MFQASHEPAGDGNTLTAFLLAVACVFIPSALYFFRPLGALWIAIGAGAGALCLTVAWVNWRRSSRLRIVPAAAINEIGKR
jgi:hypothetical protein